MDNPIKSGHDGGVRLRCNCDRARLLSRHSGKRADSIFGVTFPDLSGCTSAGDTAEEAVVNAHEALAGHIALMAEDCEPLSHPTPIEAVVPDPEITVVAITLIGVTLPGRA